ncbi:rhodanese-like domain-containing protein [Gelidibacter salicanalis]|uniref:Rhodanese-like domain-containing protein n=1 Tax=Gelidibacter salicanalis TaxID=291193 RepID=A0A934KU50_9FLAO|nr:rhodanese-like domain-containing protein [Gelidibacter salicanalis]MBJ7881411.1 rhodanese-like domain-containing protein [Gelidibacter salicanalis]
MKKLILLLLLVSLSCKEQGNQANAQSEVLTATEYKEVISNKQVQLVDVRTPEEFEAGHIENAVNIDFFRDDFKTAFTTMDKDQPIYIYCKSGNRSGKAAKILSELGFEEIYDLEGGFSNYN